MSELDQYLKKLPKEKIPQGMLWMGPSYASLKDLSLKYISLLACQAELGQKPCHQCRICHLLLEGSYPELNFVVPEENSNVIKIDQIRELQQIVFQTPKIGKQCFIVIEPADRMNNAAANALLKILEEPPKHIVFILITEKIHTLPATILSRCLKYNFYESSLYNNYLDLGQYYKNDSSRALLIKNSPMMIQSLLDMIGDKKSPSSMAAEWSKFELVDVLWLLYLITAQTIKQRLLTSKDGRFDVSALHTPKLFQQLDKINAIIQKINDNLNMNQTLLLENLLNGFLG